jgi:hypothetical protein
LLNQEFTYAAAVILYFFTETCPPCYSLFMHNVKLGSLQWWNHTWPWQGHLYPLRLRQQTLWSCVFSSCSGSYKKLLDNSFVLMLFQGGYKIWDQGRVTSTGEKARR